jgi:polyphosphate glucokinase
MKILVIDVGGSHVKFRLSDQDELRKVESGPEFTPQQLVETLRRTTADWPYEVVSIGFPAPVVSGKIALEPMNLGKGWQSFDFAAAIGKPVKLLNDAAMQALGGYQGGRMLFLGLGTGLGSALIVDGVVVSLELAHLPYKKGRTYEEYVGEAGMERMGKKKWTATVLDVVARLKAGFVADYVLLGGGNVKKIPELPPDVRRGDNGDAFLGGVRLWQPPSLPPGERGA